MVNLWRAPPYSLTRPGGNPAPAQPLPHAPESAQAADLGIHQHQELLADGSCGIPDSLCLTASRFSPTKPRLQLKPPSQVTLKYGLLPCPEGFSLS